MSAKEKIKRIAQEAAREIVSGQQQFYSQRASSDAKPSQGVVESVSDASVTVRMMDGTVQTVNAGTRWFVAGDPCIVFGGKAL